MFVSHGLIMVPAESGWYVVRPIYTNVGAVSALIEYEIIAWATMMKKTNEQLPLSPSNLTTEVLPVTYMECSHNNTEVIKQPSGLYIIQDVRYFLTARELETYFESVYTA